MFRNATFSVCALGLIVFCASGCGDRTPTQEYANVEASSGAASAVEANDGVLWQFDPEAAFIEARSSGRPVLLYFTADWCPPCHDLKAHVFTQPGFIEQSKLFVPVYLDGDQPEAQMWVEKLGVLGYPTMVVLDSSETEIVRVSGGMNLAAYEDVLETALSVTQPMDELLASLDGRDDVSLGDCQRLAYHVWSIDSAYSDSAQVVGAKLLSASGRCPVEVPIVRARLAIVAASLLAPAGARELEEHGEIGPEMWRALEAVYDISLIPEQADPNALMILSAPQEFHALSQRYGETEGVDVTTPWIESLARFAQDPQNTSFTRLFAIGGRISLLGGAEEEGDIPEADTTDAREAVARFLEEEGAGYGRSALLLPAVFTLTSIGDNEAAQSLLLEEMDHSKAPYYHMASLAQLMEDAGDNAQALDWYEQAYNESRGRETRLEWGSAYARACIRLDPNDKDGIIAASKSAISEIQGTHLSARTLETIDRLETSLKEWNADGDHDAAVTEIRSAMLEACRALDSKSGAMCAAFLIPDA